MEIAIIGAGRTAGGIGPYIAKYLHQNRMNVTAVLGSTQESAARAAAGLAQYGIQAKAYASFSDMLEQARPQAAVIASPTPTHAAYINLCLDAGLHILCDKPFAAPGAGGLTAFLVRALQKASSRKLIMAMNSQWPFVLPFYEKLCGPIVPAQANTFFMRLSPAVEGTAMIPDSLPHALSVLYCALGNGEIQDLNFTRKNEAVLLTFTYQTDQTRCQTQVELVQERSQPRTLNFGFNGSIVHRRIDPADYAMFLIHDGTELAIPDPLLLSIEDFIMSLEGAHAPRIGPNHIVRTTMLLHHIYDAAIHGEESIWKN